MDRAITSAASSSGVGWPATTRIVMAGSASDDLPLSTGSQLSTGS